MSITIDAVAAILPQTQCGLCGYGGCRPYAEAMVQQQATIDRCPPGGETTLQQLGHLFQQDSTPLLADMRQRQKPFAVAIIREQECIGCTKCIQACPVDAIIGSAKMLHSILRTECTGCELCVAPCPVDCIDIEVLPQRGYRPDKAQQRYYQRQARQQSNDVSSLASPQPLTEAPPATMPNKQAEILAAVARVKAKRMQQDKMG